MGEYKRWGTLHPAGLPAHTVSAQGTVSGLTKTVPELTNTISVPTKTVSVLTNSVSELTKSL